MTAIEDALRTLVYAIDSQCEYAGRDTESLAVRGSVEDARKLLRYPTFEKWYAAGSVKEGES